MIKKLWAFFVLFFLCAQTVSAAYVPTEHDKKLSREIVAKVKSLIQKKGEATRPRYMKTFEGIKATTPSPRIEYISNAVVYTLGGGDLESLLNPAQGHHSIAWAPVVSPETMTAYVLSKNPNPSDDILRIARAFFDIGKKYHLRGDIAFAQSIKETNYFRYGGSVMPGQNNFAGIGATSRTNPGMSFSTPEEWASAQMQHLWAYSTSEDLPDWTIIMDPRFHLVQRGSAPSWEWLGGKWAVPGYTYGQEIMQLYETMKAFKAR